MKKILIAALVAFTGSLTSFAAEQDIYFNISEKDVTSPMLSVAFNKKPVVTYSFDKGTATSYIVVNYDGQTEPFQVELNKDYDITYTTPSPATAINEVAADSKSAMSFNGNNIIVSRLAAGEQVNVYDAGGQQIAASIANDNGVATINTSSIPTGMIVIKAGTSTFKIKK